MKHGGDLSEAIAQYGGTPSAWLDLSTGINPRSWPIPDLLAAEVWQRLPSRADAVALIAAARTAYHVPLGVEIVAAPGTQRPDPVVAASGVSRCRRRRRPNPVSMPWRGGRRGKCDRRRFDR